MELIIGKFFILGCVIILFEKVLICRGVTTVHLKPVKGITEVPSRNDIVLFSAENDEDVIVVDELPEKERERMCIDGLSKIQNKIAEKDIQFSKNGKVEALKEYVLKVTNSKIKPTVSLQLLPAFKCSTYPPVYVAVNKQYDDDGKTEISIIYKDIVPLPKLEEIMNYQMAFFEDVTEAFSDDIRSIRLQNVENSLFDTDELTEELRLQLCRKATHTVWEMNVTLLENATTGMSKYYLLKKQRTSDCEDSSTVESSGVIRGIVEAFQCPTDPITYVNISDNEDEGQTLWVFLKSERNPTFNVWGYLLKVILDITEEVLSLRIGESS